MKINIKKLDDNTYKWAKYSWLLTSDKTKELLDINIPKTKCIKILRETITKDDALSTDHGETHGSNYSTIREMCLIQNIMAIEGLAPRIYRWFLIDTQDNKKRLALEMDFIDADTREETLRANAKRNKEKVKEALAQYPISYYEQELDSWQDYIGSKFVDYHGFKLNMSEYKRDLFQRIKRVTHYGKSMADGLISYQSTDDFDGKRKMEHRLNLLGSIDYKDKSVLDVGCNLGMFLHQASNKGARKMMGIDKPEVIKVAKEYANLKEKWNIDFEAKDISQIKEMPKYDIVFYMAMYEYFDIPKWLIESVGEVMYFEGHASTDTAMAMAELRKYFDVEYLGETTDRSKRMLVRCYAKS